MIGSMLDHQEPPKAQSADLTEAQDAAILKAMGAHRNG